MPRRVKLKIAEEVVEGDELDFEPLKESWNEYRCEDGSYVKLKVVVARIIRLDKTNEQGESLFQIVSTNVVAATPPPAR